MTKKRVLVTGGTRGIGFAIAKKLLEKGYAVIVCGKDRHTMSNGIMELKRYGDVTSAQFNLAEGNEVSAFAEGLEGMLYGIINNAGICKTATLDAKDNPWEEVMKTNLEGPFLLTRALLPKLENGGRIVNISSQLGKEGRAGYGAYCASKFALIGLTKCWAKELGPRGITVNAVCPGWVKTDMGMQDVARIAREKGKDPDSYYDEICGPLELGRFTEPSEVANLVSFLISEEGSGVTGRDLLLTTIWNQE